MPIYIQKRPNGNFLLRIKNIKLLPKPVYFTFDTHEEAHGYGMQLDSMLEQGIVPNALLAKKEKTENDILMVDMLDKYAAGNTAITETDVELVSYVKLDMTGVRLSGVDYQFVESLVKTFKTSRFLSPETIRKRIGLLGRAWQWYSATSNKDANHVNPFKLLPKGYSIINTEEAKIIIAAGGTVKTSSQRERRVSDDEDQRIRRVLAGEKIDPLRERAFPYDPELELMYKLIIDTGMRLRECYMLKKSYIDFEKKLLTIQNSKVHRGGVTYRKCPMKKVVATALKDWIDSNPENTTDAVFPNIWTSMTQKKEELKAISNRLSGRFSNAFAAAGVDGLQEHDLRHEATCRWVLIRRNNGFFYFSDVQICKQMGWSSMAMMLRYASLRGDESDLDEL